MKVPDLPTALIKDLLPLLNIVDLDHVQPSMKLRGISTSCVWASILREERSENPERKLTEDEWRQKAMDRLFHLAFYGFRFRSDSKYLLDCDFNSLLLVMSKYIQRFWLRSSKYLSTFTSEQRPVLSILERSVRCVEVEQHYTQVPSGPRCVLYVLHRLIDHGTAGDIVMRSPDPTLLAWILHGRRSHSASQSSQMKDKPQCSTPNAGTAQAAKSSPVLKGEKSEDDKEHVTPCKRPRLTSPFLEKEQEVPPSQCQFMAPEHICQTFNLSAGPSGEYCPQGKIHSLKIMEFKGEVLPVLLPLLPTWLCLRSLSLSSRRIFEEGDVLNLAESLKELSETSNSSLTDLSVGFLPHSSLMEVLLDSCHNLRSFSVEIHPAAEFHRPYQTQRPQSTGQTELCLERLSVKLPQVAINLKSLSSVLKRSPNLTSVHISGVRLSRTFSDSDLLQIISESNRCLKNLHLEDMNLADCHSAIFHLLGNCMLEELSLKDCRLLEKCSEKDIFMQQLVNSLKRISSLQSLNLSQNRLAKNVPALGELFTGTSPSTLKELDISFNFIQPPELLELARVLETSQPPQSLALNLSCNPLDRDPQLRDRALHTLRPLCHVLTDCWNSRASFADHISNM